MYANEAPGQKFPPNVYVYGDDTGPGSPLDFDFFFQGNTMYPEYLNDVNVLFVLFRDCGKRRGVGCV